MKNAPALGISVPCVGAFFCAHLCSLCFPKSMLHHQVPNPMQRIGGPFGQEAGSHGAVRLDGEGRSGEATATVPVERSGERAAVVVDDHCVICADALGDPPVLGRTLRVRRRVSCQYRSSNRSPLSYSDGSRMIVPEPDCCGTTITVL